MLWYIGQASFQKGKIKRCCGRRKLGAGIEQRIERQSNTEFNLHQCFHLCLTLSTVFLGIMDNLYLLLHIFLHFPSSLQWVCIIRSKTNMLLNDKVIPFKEEDSIGIAKVAVLSVPGFGLLPNNAIWVSHTICLLWTKSFQISSTEQGGLKQGS